MSKSPFNRGDEFCEWHLAFERQVQRRIVERMNMPVACVVCAKDAPLVLNQRKSGRACLLVAKGIHETTDSQADAKID